MKTMMTLILLFTLSGIVFYPGPVFADLTPRDILSHADKKRGNTEGIELVIHIESMERGRKQKRTLSVKSREHNALVQYISPAKMKGTRILRLGRNMWIAKPGLKKPFAISPRQKLVGQASNGDITSTDYAGDYDVMSVSEVVLDSERCYLMDLKAAHKEVTYDKIRYWVSMDKLRAVRADFFTVSGRMLKTATFSYDNTIIVQGQTISFLSRTVITDAIIKNNVTTLNYSKIKFRKHADSVFNINLLMR